MPLVMHATCIHCDARDASACEGITAATVSRPEIPEWQQRTDSIPFASPHLGEDGVRVTRSYPADSTIMMTSVTYHWHTAPGLPDVILRGITTIQRGSPRRWSHWTTSHGRSDFPGWPNDRHHRGDVKR